LKNINNRKIFFFKDYFQSFFEKQTIGIKKKIIWTVDLLEDLNRIPSTYLKRIQNTDDLYEIRVQYGSDIVRIFCLFDEGNLIVLLNGFNKKSQKTPKKEILSALRIRSEYFYEKESDITE